MRVINYMLRCLALYIKIVFSHRYFKFTFPIRVEKNVVLSRKKGGKLILGKHVSLNPNVHVYTGSNATISIGSYTSLGDNGMIVARNAITIGDNVMIGPNVCIYDHDHVIHKPGIMRNLGYETSPVVIEDNVWLAAGVVVLKGVTIGEGSVIAAGTLINKDVPKNSIVYNKKEIIIRSR